MSMRLGGVWPERRTWHTEDETVVKKRGGGEGGTMSGKYGPNI